MSEQHDNPRDSDDRDEYRRRVAAALKSIITKDVEILAGLANA